MLLCARRTPICATQALGPSKLWKSQKLPRQPRWRFLTQRSGDSPVHAPRRLSSFAQFEREVTGERIRDKIAASKKRGMWMGGMPPLGYDVKNRKLIINDAEARIVVAIYRRYLAMKSVHALRDALADAGIMRQTNSKRCSWHCFAAWKSNPIALSARSPDAA